MTNKVLAKSMFNTIVAISEDEMQRYLHNTEQICRNEPSYKYSPNMQKPPIWIERVCETNNIPLYKNKRKEIAEDFLIKEIQKDYSGWTIDKCEIGTLCYAISCGLDFNDRDFALVFSELFPTMIRCCKIRDHYEFLDYSSKREVIHFLGQYLTTQRDIETVLTIMFDSVDFADITNDGIEVYIKIGSYFLPSYFDGYINSDIRRLLESNIFKLEKRILTLPERWVKQKLSGMLLLSFPRYSVKDWNEYQTSYSYADKMFLIELWSRYGHDHFIELINIIYQLHITELLPEILIPIHGSIKNLEAGNRKELKQQVNAVKSTLNMIITKAFLGYSDKIKGDAELMTAFEGILVVLVSLRIEEAAVILDEFRIH